MSSITNTLPNTFEELIGLLQNTFNECNNKDPANLSEKLKLSKKIICGLKKILKRKSIHSKKSLFDENKSSVPPKPIPANPNPERLLEEIRNGVILKKVYQPNTSDKQNSANTGSMENAILRAIRRAVMGGDETDEETDEETDDEWDDIEGGAYDPYYNKYLKYKFKYYNLKKYA